MKINNIEIQNPKVVLVNWTQNPIETMCFARQAMLNKLPDTIEEIKQDPEKWLGMSVDDYVNKMLLPDGMPTFLEYISLTFKVENVSRAWTHQMVRHRIGFSYSQQSMRCVKAENFASNGMFHLPSTVEDKEKFVDNMLDIEKIYNEAIASGMSAQDARGLLPTNIYTSMTFSCSLRAFIGMINKRLCFMAQGEWKEVASQMVAEIINKIDPRITKWIGPPCKFGYCIAKGDQEQKYLEGKITGKANTDYCCPLFIGKFKKPKE